MLSVGVIGSEYPNDRRKPSENTAMIVAKRSARGSFSFCFGYGGFSDTIRKRFPSSRLRSHAVLLMRDRSLTRERKELFNSGWTGLKMNSIPSSRCNSEMTEKRLVTAPIISAVVSVALPSEIDVNWETYLDIFTNSDEWGRY